MMEWRDGKIMDDDEIEKYWQFCERKPKPKHPVIKYDILMGWALLGLGVGAFWALVWMLRPTKYHLIGAAIGIPAGWYLGKLIKWLKRKLKKQ